MGVADLSADVSASDPVHRAIDALTAAMLELRLLERRLHAAAEPDPAHLAPLEAALERLNAACERLTELRETG